MNETVGESPLLGEVIVNKDEVLRNAEMYHVSYAQELARCVAHGVLHLMGYTDDTPQHKAAMSSIEDSVVSEFMSDQEGGTHV